MNVLWWCWVISLALIVLSTVYTILVRGRPGNAFYHVRNLSRWLLAAACLYAIGRALSGPVKLPGELFVMALAMAVIMVTRAISETRRHRRERPMRFWPCP